MTGSTLEITPRTARGVISNAEPNPPIYGSTGIGTAFRRATQPGYRAWLNHIRAAAGCTRPIRLTGAVDVVDPATGERTPGLPTAHLPDGVIYKACGNRRGTVCPSCAETYQRDAYHLLRAGMVGGKGVPYTVSVHPAVFATLTAPSFGLVHTRAVRRHTCRDRRRCGCRPDPCHPRRDRHGEPGTCEHGQPAVCWTRHTPDAARLGQPLCLDCYHHDHQVVWNAFAGELWRRTKQAIERHLTTLARRRGIPPVLVLTPAGTWRKASPVRVSHGKAAEFQARGAVHFHALLRLDGVDPLDPTAVLPPPAGIGVADLTDAMHAAAAQARYMTPPHPDQPDGWPIRWGAQVDVRPIVLGGRGEVTDRMVAGYLAKYATKATEATGHTSTRITTDTIDLHADEHGTHTARLIDACWRLGRPTTKQHTALPQRRAARRLGPRWRCRSCRRPTRLRICPRCTGPTPADTRVSNAKRDNPYARLRRWAHMLGFGGHFLTKGRRYSVTFSVLRSTRIAYRRTQDQEQAPGSIRTADHLGEETTLVVGALTFAGIGWHTTGDALLANTAAAMARARQRAAREELAHAIGATLTAGIALAAA
ncbi:MAG TPA: replication initiator [Micromonosporaceae bacterium]|jgi:hypothetical protein